MSEVDLTKVEQRIITSKEAKPFVCTHHYSGKLPPACQVIFGYYYNETLIGIITYGLTASPSGLYWLQNIDESLTSDNYLELTRLCIHPEYHIKNLASTMISQTFSYLRKERPLVKILTSYADTNQKNLEGINHIGYIYQATNWIFCGQGRARDKFIVDGKEMHERNDYCRKGTIGSDHKIETIKTLPKQKYIYFLCDKKTKREYIKKIEILPYPKKDKLVEVKTDNFFKKDLTNTKPSGILLNAVEVSKDTASPKAQGLVRLQDSAPILDNQKPIEKVMPKQSDIKLKENTFLITEENQEAFDLLISDLNYSEVKFFCFDVETDGQHFILAKLDGIGFYIPQSGRAYYINCYKESEGWVEKVINKVRPYFVNEKIGKIGHNILFDIHIMQNYGVDVNGPLFDTMIASYLVNPDDRPFGLKRLVPKHLKIEMREYDDIDRENILDMAIYCMEDAKNTCLLYVNRKEALVRQNLWRLFNDIEMPFLRVLFKIERRGIRVDRDKLSALRIDYEQKVEELKLQFCEKMFGVASDKVLITVTKKVKKESKRVDVPFNIESNDHLNELFYNIKKYPVLSRTPIKIKTLPDGTVKKSGGKPSADKAALGKLAERGYEGLDLLLKYRELKTLLKNFIVPILDTHMIRGRVHASYLQHGTRTGRLSSSRPNFQNIPVRSEYGKEIRKCFIPDEGYKFIDADLSQIELRVMAHYSKDQQLMKAYKDNIDLHTLTGELVLGIKGREMTKSERTLCKNLNFGLQYGAGPRKFAILAKISEEEATEYIAKYFKKYNQVKAFQLIYPNEVRRVGYATTVLGRVRFLPDIKLSKVSKENWKKVSAAEREALSTLIQGSASDILKLAMLRADKQGILLVGQIHDQLLATDQQDKVVSSAKILKESMEHCGLTFEVPIVANVKIADRWECETEDVIEGEEEETQET